MQTNIEGRKTRKERSDFWKWSSGPGPRIMAADTLEGDKVKNAAVEDLGTIEHIMLDVPMGREHLGDDRVVTLEKVVGRRGTQRDDLSRGRLSHFLQ